MQFSASEYQARYVKEVLRTEEEDVELEVKVLDLSSQLEVRIGRVNGRID